MIRPLTLLGGIAFLASGLYVFQTKEEVARLERELRTVHREVEEQRARTRLLAAEWARLNDQDRLRQLAQTHLRDMQPMEPAQFVRMEDAPRRLPAAQAFAAAGNNAFRTRGDLPTAPGEALVFRGAPLLAEAPTAPAAPAAVAAPPRVAAPAPPATELPPAEPPRAAVPPRPAPRPAEPAVAAPESTEPTRPRVELAALPPVAGPAQAAPRPAAVRAEPPREAPPRAPALRTAAHVPPAAAPAPAGSLLGGGVALPPPVPVAR